jgi:diguanylate cyclase (GGDEF)-like protein
MKELRKRTKLNNLAILRGISRVSSIRNFIWISSILVLSFLIGYLDYLTGPDFIFSPFNLIPSLLAARKLSSRWVFFVAFINSIIWLWVDFSSGRFPTTVPVYVWNFISRLIFLLVVALLFSSLRKSMDREKRLASIDNLTKALNSRVFKEILGQEIKRSVRYQHSLTLAYMDIDNFKSVNDQFGHETGDKVLSTICKEIRNDVLGRLGGDEFAILLVETNSTEARNVITELQKKLLKTTQANNWPISLSFGVLSCTHNYCEADKMISLADELMYSVKESTKNNASYAIYPEIEENNQVVL